MHDSSTRIANCGIPNSRRRLKEDFMSDGFTPHQQKIIKRYYENIDAISIQKLAEQVTDLYLADGKKRLAVWKRIIATLQNLKIPEHRINHLREKDDPQLFANP